MSSTRGRTAPSLGRRLVAGSALFTLVALLVTLFVMQHVLLRFVTGQIDQRLDNKIVTLASQIMVGPDGTIRLEGDADGPPFDRPHHHAFWWVRGPKNDLHSAWLRAADYTPPSAAALAALPSPPAPPPPPGEAAPDPRGQAQAPAQTIDGRGPGGVAMHIRVARRRFGATGVTILVAASEAAIAGPMREAMTTVAIAVACLGAGLLLAALAQVRLGLRPLARLRGQVEAVRAGRAAALPIDQPREILPLVVELNALLVQNAEGLVRARRHVANLAHGLKTPLATLSLTVDRLDDDQRTPLQSLVGTIERRIRHHLGRARAAALDGPTRAQTVLAERLRDLADALTKIHAGKAVAVLVDCPAEIAVACEPQDVDEILGNLLENAFKYTASRVECSVRAEGRAVTITIADDGPGVRSEDVERVMHPGQRLDETVPGFGFGLPIARELAELYGGGLALAPAELGLRVTLTLPGVRS